MIVDPWGTIVAQAPDAVAIVRADLDLDRVEALRRQIPVLANRRPDAYEADGQPSPTGRTSAARARAPASSRT